MYCGQKFQGDVSRYRAHLWNHQQKVCKFWYNSKQNGTGVSKSRRKFFKKRPERFIFLRQDPSRHKLLEMQDSVSVETNPSEDSFYDSGNLKCRFCEAFFTDEEQLAQHEKFHSTSKPYVCLICGQGFKIRGHLARHEIIHQRNEKHGCDFCNATFAKTSQLKVHRVIHLTGDNPEEELSQVPQLDINIPKQAPKMMQHQKQKKVRPLKIVLGQKFVKPKVEVHEEKVFQEDDSGAEADVQSVNVDFIEKKIIEQRSALGEGKVCKYCSKRCASARDLMEHERKHTGEKPHQVSHL